ncbi:MAG: hypothetical protein HN929_07080 [Chloroflexi bacterium]|nr:hypothetical protein [Chloroflexota bacterium]MBT7081210.1 hypothetical protein [Chloroflexota bacterium]MBT7290265.1 hypothetical protein [Chloroflexota bacterium]
MAKRIQTKMQVLKLFFPNDMELLILGGPDKMTCLQLIKGGEFTEISPDILRRVDPGHVLGNIKSADLHFNQLVQSCQAK